MTNLYSHIGKEVHIVEENESLSKDLPLGTYVVKFAPPVGYYLESVDALTLPSKVYGKADGRAERIINTYHSRSASTGIMLKGEKGSGKTLLTKILSNHLHVEGISTIIINSEFAGDVFNTFIASIKEPALIIFDEFDKTYSDVAQQAILTLLDGTITTKKLFAITCNDGYRINDYMNNRPGRIYYSYTYEGLESEFIREYCEDELHYKQHTNDIVSLSHMFTHFNFDMLKAVVEEINRYNESVAEIIQHLNVSPKDGNYDRYQGVSFEPGTEYSDTHFEDIEVGEVNSGSHFNPFKNSFHVRWNGKIIVAKSKGEEEDAVDYDDYNHSQFGHEDITKFDKDGNITFENAQGKLVIERMPTKGFNFQNAF